MVKDLRVKVNQLSCGVIMLWEYEYKLYIDITFESYDHSSLSVSLIYKEDMDGSLAHFLLFSLFVEVLAWK